MDALTPEDATRFWLSRRTRNDLFLLYCFTDAGRPSDELRAELARRSAGIADLSVRVRERRFGYPRWVAAEFGGEPIVEHPVAARAWANVVAALGEILGQGVDAARCPWRLHLFRSVTGAPGGDEPALVAVLQLSHALADGRRAAAVARALFTEIATPGDGLGTAVDSSRVEPKPRAAAERDTAHRVRGGSARRALGGVKLGRVKLGGVKDSAPRALGGVKETAGEVGSLMAYPVRLARTVIRGLAAERARRELAVLTERGEVAPPAPSFAPTPLNRLPAPSAHVVRMLVRDDLRVPGSTVTVVVLTAIGAALTRYLASRGAPAAELGAQVSMARPERNRRSRNNYRDVGTALHGTEPDPVRRARRIAADLAARRARAAHPLLAVRDRVTEALPAAVLRRDIAGYPMDLVPDALSGHTVVSSVHRGPADLVLGGGAVRFTGGFPALGAVMHLTHGVHGLGDTVTVSVHADPAAVPDLDDYASLLAGALTEAVAALRAAAS
ncbi:WS/DGAT domain-containing protein [Nocardia blacklockiae]|uniref:WS/DGAT domain-containing protein n=1 Tax=Nocardia blacklockiae TaxID=480036 RepID=UPI0018935AE4|nr:WS/DGAT domain-containing protein [Nocardia blacklockiae]MBF6173383.1 DUF1298 domain-containing protein [Nocardia blacklockiae]